VYSPVMAPKTTETANIAKKATTAKPKLKQTTLAFTRDHLPRKSKHDIDYSGKKEPSPKPSASPKKSPSPSKPLKRKRDDENLEPSQNSSKIMRKTPSPVKKNSPVPEKKTPPPKNRTPAEKVLPQKSQSSKHTLSPQKTISKTVILDEKKGDLFAAAPNNAVLIHACNCQGRWGKGIAAIFAKKYPKAFKVYQSHCQPHIKAGTTKSLVGTAQLIEPLDKKKHFVGCLYTSDNSGMTKGTPAQILAATKPAIESLIAQINTWNKTNKKEDRVQSLYICKINSKLFNVPWKDTKKLLESMAVDLQGLEPKIMIRDLN